MQAQSKAAELCEADCKLAACRAENEQLKDDAHSKCQLIHNLQKSLQDACGKSAQLEQILKALGHESEGFSWDSESEWERVLLELESIKYGSIRITIAYSSCFAVPWLTQPIIQTPTRLDVLQDKVNDWSQRVVNQIMYNL